MRADDIDQRVLAAVTTDPATSRDLAKDVALDPYQVRASLGRLRRAGHVECASFRCPVCGGRGRARVWRSRA